MQLATPTRRTRAAVLPPALAAAKARGVRDRRPCGAPARPSVTPVPAPPSALEVCALLDAAARARGAAHGVDLRRYSSCRALLAALHSLARTRERERPVSGTVRSSWGYLAKLVGELLGWERESDHYDNAGRRRSSLRRWLRELEAAGLLRTAVVYDDEGQERGVDVELLPVPTLAADALERAGERLGRWRRRYGDGVELAARRSGAILARLQVRRRALAARFPTRRRRGSDTSGPPLPGAVGSLSDPSNPSSPCKASSSARAGTHARAGRRSYTRSTAPDITSVSSAPSAVAKGSEDGGDEASLGVRRALWEQQIGEAEVACQAFRASVDDPLPPLVVLRLALAGRCQSAGALAAGDPVGGLGPRLARKLRRAAASWMRWRPHDAPDAAGELLRRTDEHPAAGLGVIVRGFVVAAHRQARHARAERTARLDAAHRRAVARREQLLAAWPGWLDRADDRLVLDPGGRFVQVHRLPTLDELCDPELRRWLRAITALQWFAPASAIELTDPDGRYAYVPLDARLAADGERTRGPWISQQPRRRQALERARRAISERRARRGR